MKSKLAQKLLEVNEKFYNRPNIVRYPIEGYPRDNQEPVGKAVLKNARKNYDDHDTWSGLLIGPKEDVIATLIAWGEPQVTFRMLPVTRARAEELVQEAVEWNEVEDEEDGEDEEEEL